jgi:hypothetical protein
VISLDLDFKGISTRMNIPDPTFNEASQLETKVPMLVLRGDFN